MKVITQICRWIVGVLFIFSGLIKLNDPLGFSYKLDEYFSAQVLGLEFLQPIVLPLAIFIVIFEVVLGVMLLLGYMKKFTIWNLLLMIVFFTFLTFYSAYFNKVTDCGCFGDAIPLTPWESFAKDVILSILILIIFFNIKYIKPLFAKAKSTIIILLITIICFIIAYYVLMHLPILDFRAYKIGTNIEEGMAEDPNDPDIYGYDWYYTIDGKQEVVTTEGLPPEGYPVYDKVETRIIHEGYVPPIHDFSITAGDEDLTSDVLQKDKVALIISYNLDKSESEGLYKLNSFIDRALVAGYEVMALSAASESQAQEVMQRHGFEITFYVTDETALKTMIRSNPGVVLLEEGTITAKSHWNDIDSMEL